MIPVASVNNMRISDRNTIETKMPSRELMYKAGKGIFEAVDWHGKILIVCGSGNNAGDGYVVAALLKERGFDVEILLLEKRFSSDGQYYFDKCLEQNVPWSVYNFQNFSEYDIILDCIFGTGFKGEIEGIAKEVIEKINNSCAYVVSADINSGLNGDSGMGQSCVKSKLTVSIGSLKSGHLLGMAKDKIGELTNVDIGIDLVEKPYYLLEAEDVKKLLGKRDNFSNKGTFGYITLIGGCLEYGGAIKLANMASSAMRAGCGVVRIAAPKSACQGITPYILESTLYPLSDRDGSIKFEEKEIQGALNNVKAVAIGMGLGQKGDNEKIIKYILKNYEIPVIIDADGLNTLAKMDVGVIKNSKCSVILTPHLKEFERLSCVPMMEIQENPIRHAMEYAKSTGVILLLKGPTTIITDGEDVILSGTGCAGMATAGSGDVLSGILCAMCARSSDLFRAVSASAYINGYAGEIAQREFGDISMIASDTIRSIATAIKELSK